ncbi:MAG: SpoIIE family protein phosphatase [Leptonema sp. (in: Bacteria)]|nr:SpoIIE family protein phosphatase [Leptonema sp. (in: bacteria)]
MRNLFNKQISFGLKLGISLSVISIFAISSGIGYFYYSASDAVWSLMGKRLKDIGRVGQFLFTEEVREAIIRLNNEVEKTSLPRTEEFLSLEDGDAVDGLSEEDIDRIQESDDFQTVVQVLRQIKNGSSSEVIYPQKFEQLPPNLDDRPTIESVYLLATIPQSSDKKVLVFLADSDYGEVDTNGNGVIEENEEANYVGTLYGVENQPELVSAFLGSPTRSKGYYTDNWGTYFSAYIPIIDKQGKTIAVMGMDMNVNSELNIVQNFAYLSYGIIVVGFLVLILASIIISKWLTRPINALRDGAEQVRNRNFDVQIDVKSKDELGLLANTFNYMVREIKAYAQGLEQLVDERTKELQKTLNRVQQLKNQQDADYFLTTLLADPLFRDRNRSETVATSFLLNQKKKFKFKNKEAELGGDLVITGNLNFSGSQATMFFNGDAMGKSMQGAGGALVMGALINAIMARSAANKRVLTISPTQWLQNTFTELQRVFEAFDGSMMVSCVMGVIENQTGQLYYFNAEHPFSVLYRNGEASFLEEEILLRKIGMPIQNNFKVLELQLQPNDVLICGSDGRDDIKLGDAENFEDINHDENLFVEVVKRSNADLNQIVTILNETGKLVDDLSLLRVEYQPLVNGQSQLSSQPESIRNVIDLVKSKKFESALELLEKANDKSSFFYLYYRGLALTKLGRYTEALDLLTAADNAVGEHAAIHRMLGKIYLNLGDNAQALDFFQKALAIEPDHKATVQIVRQLLSHVN